MKKVIAGMVMAVSMAGLAHAGGDAATGQAKSATCAACHGADGNSMMGNFPSLAGQGERYLVKQMQDVKSGARAIPEMTGLLDNLSQQDLEDIAAYFASQKGGIGQAKPELVEAGQALYRGGNLANGVAACTACHSPNGSGNAPAGFPRLSGQHPEYTAKQLRAFRSGERANDGESRMMRDVAARLTDAEIEAVANYLRGLH
ncbi:MAG: cytochrome c4 [Gammaproteobacteria bacterium]|nr:cytochrome c4 [Gammaproteobacteria bacterium]